MKKVRLTELGESFQKAVGDAAGEPLVVENDQGVAQYSVYRVGTPTPEQKRAAIEGLQKLQDQADASMKKQGKTEADLMDVILEDD